jgi:hypothetical protein
VRCRNFFRDIEIGVFDVEVLGSGLYRSCDEYEYWNSLALGRFDALPKEITPFKNGLRWK